MKIYPNGYRFLSCSHFYTISGIKVGVFLLYLYLNGYNMGNQTIAEYVKRMRRETGLRLDKVNQVLSLFGSQVGVVPTRKEEL